MGSFPEMTIYPQVFGVGVRPCGILHCPAVSRGILALRISSSVTIILTSFLGDLRLSAMFFAVPPNARKSVGGRKLYPDSHSFRKWAIWVSFLTRGYARVYHELLQGQVYTNESLAHS